MSDRNTTETETNEYDELDEECCRGLHNKMAMGMRRNLPISQTRNVNVNATTTITTETATAPTTAPNRMQRMLNTNEEGDLDEACYRGLHNSKMANRRFLSNRNAEEIV